MRVGWKRMMTVVQELLIIYDVIRSQYAAFCDSYTEW